MKAMQRGSTAGRHRGVGRAGQGAKDWGDQNQVFGWQRQWGAEQQAGWSRAARALSPTRLLTLTLLLLLHSCAEALSDYGKGGDGAGSSSSTGGRLAPSRLRLNGRSAVQRRGEEDESIGTASRGGGGLERLPGLERGGMRP